MSSEVETSLIINSERFLDFARNDTLEKLQRDGRRLSPGSGGQLVNLKFRRRFDQCRVIRQVRAKLWIRLRPPKSVPGENEMRCSRAHLASVLTGEVKSIG